MMSDPTPVYFTQVCRCGHPLIPENFGRCPECGEVWKPVESPVRFPGFGSFVLRNLLLGAICYLSFFNAATAMVIPGAAAFVVVLHSMIDPLRRRALQVPVFVLWGVIANILVIPGFVVITETSDDPVAIAVLLISCCCPMIAAVDAFWRTVGPPTHVVAVIAAVPVGSAIAVSLAAVAGGAAYSISERTTGEDVAVALAVFMAVPIVTTVMALTIRVLYVTPVPRVR